MQGVDQQVQKTVSLGAKLLTGGNRIKREGFFYEPTVLTDIPRESPAFSEEVFGPVASIFRAQDAADAIEISNSTLFGLGASAWTNDREEQELFASELEAGMVFINGMVVFRSAIAVWRSEAIRLRSRTRAQKESANS